MKFSKILKKIINEFCEGGELFKRINQILDAVIYLHELNIVHCDIKPENIMLSNKKNNFSLLKLIDY